MRIQFHSLAGNAGGSHPAHLRTLQEFLNRIPPSAGGPIHQVPVSGLWTEATERALRQYLGTAFTWQGAVITQVGLPKGDADSKEELHLTLEIKLQPLSLIPTFTFNSGNKTGHDNWGLGR
jgi:hypothetical protein